MYKSVKGMDDILPESVSVWQKIEQEARDLFKVYNYNELRTPILEQTDLFARGIGEVTDIVQKEMYTFADNKGRSLTLRPEATAPVVRSYIEHNMQAQGGSQKLFYIGSMFRYERPQAGRSRQFHQIGVEAIGLDDPSIDAEVVYLLKHLLEKLGISEIIIKLNSSGCKDCRPGYMESLKDYLKNKLDSLCKDCNVRFEKNIMRVLDCKNPECNKQFENVPAIKDNLCNKCNEHFELVKVNLNTLGVNFIIDDRLVRGLDYYTKTVFEAVSNKLGAQNAIGAGGRYDNLIKLMNGPDMPAIGFALGMERIVKILNDTDKAEKKHDRYGVFFASLGEQAFSKAMVLVQELRNKGIRSGFDYNKRALKTQLRCADKDNYKFIAVIGDNELKENKVKIKNLNTGEEKEVDLDKIIKEVKKT